MSNMKKKMAEVLGFSGLREVVTLMKMGGGMTVIVKTIAAKLHGQRTVWIQKENKVDFLEYRDVGEAVPQRALVYEQADDILTRDGAEFTPSGCPNPTPAITRSWSRRGYQPKGAPRFATEPVKYKVNGGTKTCCHWTKAEWAQASRLREEGKTYREIAASLYETFGRIYEDYSERSVASVAGKFRSMRGREEKEK